MSNIAFITTRKRISSYDITALLQEINQRRFGGKMTVKSDENCWSVEYSKIDVGRWECPWDGIDYYENSPKKLGAKHPHTSWMGYVLTVFNEELALATNGILSDEGISETWKPCPEEYPSYQKWIERMHQFSLKRAKQTRNPLKKFAIQKAVKQIMKMELSMCPKEMEQY